MDSSATLHQDGYSQVVNLPYKPRYLDSSFPRAVIRTHLRSQSSLPENFRAIMSRAAIFNQFGYLLASFSLHLLVWALRGAKMLQCTSPRVQDSSACSASATGSSIAQLCWSALALNGTGFLAVFRIHKCGFLALQLFFHAILGAIWLFLASSHQYQYLLELRVRWQFRGF